MVIKIEWRAPFLQPSRDQEIHNTNLLVPFLGWLDEGYRCLFFWLLGPAFIGNFLLLSVRSALRGKFYFPSSSRSRADESKYFIGVFILETLFLICFLFGMRMGSAHFFFPIIIIILLVTKNIHIPQVPLL